MRRSAGATLISEYVPQTIQSWQCCLTAESAWRSAGLIFIHIPRTAGTSISTALYGRALGHFGFKQVALMHPRLLAHTPVLAVVRNPWDRLVSAYDFMLSGGTPEVPLRRSTNYAKLRKSDFSAFLEWLSNERLESIDNIFRPQHQFISPDELRPGFDLLLRYEELDDLSGLLSSFMRRRICVTQLNRGSRTERFRSYYDPAAVDLVRKLYAADISAFGYDFA
jgi:hypothetical protein